MKNDANPVYKSIVKCEFFKFGLKMSGKLIDYSHFHLQSKIHFSTFTFLKFLSLNNLIKLKMVGIIMGSQSDLPIMELAANFLKSLDIPYELTVVSAHRTPERMFDYAKHAKKRGLKVIIAGAGGAAHLPGMVASCTTLPVIGVPILSSNSIDGWDSVLSILQMPGGIPVATVALNGALNAGILAAKILGTGDENVAEKLQIYQDTLKDKVLGTVDDIKAKHPNLYDL
jgi:5-(carboxyamino)imidazole ribonucleotide mutase